MNENDMNFDASVLHFNSFSKYLAINQFSKKEEGIHISNYLPMHNLENTHKKLLKIMDLYYLPKEAGLINNKLSKLNMFGIKGIMETLHNLSYQLFELGIEDEEKVIKYINESNYKNHEDLVQKSAETLAREGILSPSFVKISRDIGLFIDEKGYIPWGLITVYTKINESLDYIIREAPYGLLEETTTLALFYFFSLLLEEEIATRHCKNYQSLRELYKKSLQSFGGRKTHERKDKLVKIANDTWQEYKHLKIPVLQMAEKILNYDFDWWVRQSRSFQEKPSISTIVSWINKSPHNPKITGRPPKIHFELVIK